MIDKLTRSGADQLAPPTRGSAFPRRAWRKGEKKTKGNAASRDLRHLRYPVAIDRNLFVSPAVIACESFVCVCRGDGCLRVVCYQLFSTPRRIFCRFRFISRRVAPRRSGDVCCAILFIPERCNCGDVVRLDVLKKLKLLLRYTLGGHSSTRTLRFYFQMNSNTHTHKEKERESEC